MGEGVKNPKIQLASFANGPKIAARLVDNLAEEARGGKEIDVRDSVHFNVFGSKFGIKCRVTHPNSKNISFSSDC